MGIELAAGYLARRINAERAEGGDPGAARLASLDDLKKGLAFYPRRSREVGVARKSDLLQGTLDMLVLRVLSREELHGWGITQKLELLSARALQVDEGSLYPALYRMEEKGWITAEWRVTENNRRAKYYSLTRTGRKQLQTEQEGWERMSAIIAQVMQAT